MQTSRDVPMHIRSETTWSERRITPSWTIAHLKSKLEPITGVPPSSQKLALRLPGQVDDPIEGANEEATELSRWNLQAGAEIYVSLTFGISCHDGNYIAAFYHQCSQCDYFASSYTAYSSRIL